MTYLFRDTVSLSYLFEKNQPEAASIGTPRMKPHTTPSKPERVSASPKMPSRANGNATYHLVTEDSNHG